MATITELTLADDEVERLIVSGRRVLALAALTVLLVSRGWERISHPILWAEDGVLWFQGAYSHGVPSLLWTASGYYQTFPRLVALAGLFIPTTYLPALFLVASFVVQIAPIALMIWRGESIIPSAIARWALILFYVGIPNSNEIFLNLTNAQWHFAPVLFLLIVLAAPKSAAGRYTQYAILLLGGLSGPFAVFLAPIAWWHAFTVEKAEPRYAKRQAIVLSVPAAIQLLSILMHSAAGRTSMTLGANVHEFARILTNQVFLAALIGHNAVLSLQAIVLWRYGVVCEVCVLGLCLMAVAWWRGPSLFRKFALFGLIIFAAGLKSPMASFTEPQWPVMERSLGSRYFFFAMLMWFSSVLVLACLPSAKIKYPARVLLACFAIGISVDWFYGFDDTAVYTAYQSSALAFDSAAPGATVSLPEEPGGWHMMLVKH